MRERVMLQYDAHFKQRLVATIRFARLNKKFYLRYKVYDKSSDVKYSLISSAHLPGVELATAGLIEDEKRQCKNLSNVLDIFGMEYV
jgi:hypothetical protein